MRTADAISATNAEPVLHGRERELARLALAIGSGTDGTRFARVRGVSGIGKSTLVSRAAFAASSAGFESIMVRGRAGSLGTPLAPLAEAFTSLAHHLSEQRATGAPLDLDRAVATVRHELETRALSCAQIIVIDDANALDASSLALIDAVLAFENEVNVSVVLVEQTDGTSSASYMSFVDQLGARQSILTIDVAELADDAMAKILMDVLALEDASQIPTTVVERAGGNPWFAIELAATWRAGAHDVPRNVAAAAAARMHGLDAAAREIVQLCAVCPTGAQQPWIESLLADVGGDAHTLTLVTDSGLVCERDGVLEMQHPLMRAAIVDSMSVARRRALHRELAAVIDATDSITAGAARASGHHLAAGGRPVDAIARFQAAATAHDSHGLPHEAYADMVSALGCELRVTERVETLRACARAATYLGIRDAVVHWSELGRMAASIHDDELYAYALVQQYWASHDGTAIDRLRRAANLGADRVGWSARAAATLARLDGKLPAAIDHDQTAIEIARERGDTELEVLALEKLASSHALTGNTREAIGTCRTAIARAIAARVHDSAAISWGCLVETLVDELATAEALAEAQAADAYVSELGLTRKRPALLAWQTSVLIRMGDLDTAARVANEAVALDQSFQTDPSYRKEHFGALVALLRAEVANELGDPAAMEYVDRAAMKIEELGYHSWQLEVDYERARAVARRDGIDAALPFIADVESSGEPVFVAAVARWLARAGASAASSAALARVRELRAVGYAWIDTAVTQLTRDEIDAIVGCIDDGAEVAALREIAMRWRAAGRTLDGLRVEQIIGVVLLGRGDRAAARATLRATFTELSARRAAGDVDSVAALLRRAGTRTRAAIRQSDVGTLTERELEIARLAAGGAKNREIAASLFITENTVTAHMTSVYEKTEVGSRVRLAQWLREHDGVGQHAPELAAM
jgi:DNA-binding CsgD family transcriptional regulator/tetratricopeptide (TPR) repeat protein